MKVYSLENQPHQWAIIQKSIGDIYYHKGDLELSIIAYNSCLQTYDRHEFTTEYASIQYHLGAAYYHRVDGDNKENIELSIKAFEISLVIYNKDKKEKFKKIDVRYYLGNLYRKRINGDREENIELSIAYSKLALDAFNSEDLEFFSSRYSAIWNDLGTSYIDRSRGNKALNIEIAINAFKIALKGFNNTKFQKDVDNDYALEKCAETHNNLGNAYSKRISNSKKNDLKMAIDHYRQASNVFTIERFPNDWADIQNNLGCIYSDRIEGDSQSNIDLSIGYYKMCLEIYSYHSSPERWAVVKNNLGVAFSKKITSTVGSQENFTREAIDAYQAALSVYKLQTFPTNCLQTAVNLGELTFKLNLWQQAIDAFSTAINALENIRGESNENNKQNILIQAIHIYEYLIQAAVNTNQIDLALETVERIRSKRLIELMATPDLYRDSTIPSDVLALLTHIDKLHYQINQIRPVKCSANDENKSLSPTRNSTKLQQIDTEILTLQKQLQQTLRELAIKDPVAAGFNKVNSIPLDQLQKLVPPKSAILSFYTTKNDTLIFILQYNSPPQLFTCKGQGYANLQTWLQTSWLQEYAITKNHKNDKDEKDYEPWKSNIPVKLAALSERLQLPELINQHLQDIESLIIIPHLALHYIPFAALPINAKPPELGQKQQTLGDKFQISHTPAAQILKYCKDRAPLTNQQYGIIENATNDLKKTPGECQTVAILHNVPDRLRLIGKPQATIENYRKLLNYCNNILSSHHATADLDNPLESSLLLGDGRISVGQLISPGWRFKNLDEVFMSCCETNLGNQTNLADELLTISTGYLCAGARGVIGTLWVVDDQATALFSSIYHYYRHQGIPRAAALQQTQNNFRSTTKTPACAVALKTIFDEQKTQAQSQQKLAKTRRDQYPANSSEYQEQQQIVDRHAEQAQSFYSMKQDIEKLGTRKNPYTSEFYWAAFTCNGIG